MGMEAVPAEGMVFALVGIAVAAAGSIVGMAACTG